MTANRISCVVVVDKNDQKKAVGIVTKTDLIQAYENEIPLSNNAGSVMTKVLKTVNSTTQRDDVAKMMEGNQFHHAVVVDDKTGEYVGLVSAWDVATEIAKDARAWPYTRTPDGKIHR
jgi:CBS domain-containing protein